MTENTKRPIGRPPTKHGAYDPVRTAGRVPADVWEACAARARADGQSMTAFITDALRRELERRTQR